MGVFVFPKETAFFFFFCSLSTEAFVCFRTRLKVAYRRAAGGVLGDLHTRVAGVAVRGCLPRWGRPIAQLIRGFTSLSGRVADADGGGLGYVAFPSQLIGLLQIVVIDEMCRALKCSGCFAASGKTYRTNNEKKDRHDLPPVAGAGTINSF